MYNPAVGKMQDWIYDLYLKGNKIKSGLKNYSEVVGLPFHGGRKLKLII